MVLHSYTYFFLTGFVKVWRVIENVLKTTYALLLLKIRNKQIGKFCWSRNF